MQFLVIILFLLSYQPTKAWFMKDKSHKCSDVGQTLSPQNLLSWKEGKCTRVSETQNKHVFNCNSEVEAYKGIFSVYPNLEFCIQDGGKIEKEQHNKIKETWAKNYNSKLWSTIIDTCKKSVSKCSLSKIKTKEFLESVKPTLESTGLNCGSTFDVMFETTTPPNNFKMSLICMNPKNMCAISVFFFETEKECNPFREQQASKK